MKKMLLRIGLLFSFLFFLLNVQAQDGVIHLKNPSFEDFPRPGIAPRGWYSCGAIMFPKETPPDIHPSLDKPFGVTKPAFDGQTYLGMTVRENESWESVAQRLTIPIKRNQCYSFSIYLATSEVYKSFIRGGNKEVEFIDPIKLRIWGGSGYCKKTEILGESPLIDHYDWREYKFKFTPKKKHKYIILEAFFTTPTIKAPNGNILLDKASMIVSIDCDSTVISQTSEEYLAQTKMKLKETEIQSSELLLEKNTKRLLMNSGNAVKFKKNQLTQIGIHNIQTLAHAMKKLPNHKLIIDFNGLKKKKAEPRKNQLMNILIQEGMDQKKIEIRNTIDEDDSVEWLVDKKYFFMGVQPLKQKK